MEAAEDLVAVENITAACKAYDGARTPATDLKNDIRLIGDTAAGAGDVDVTTTLDRRSSLLDESGWRSPMN